MGQIDCSHQLIEARNQVSNTIYITGDTKQDALYRALGEAQKGDRIVYHVGQYCNGLHRYAAAKAESEKLCLLFCRRAGPGLFEYIAVKR
jgi:hypothetical protein